MEAFPAGLGFESPCPPGGSGAIPGPFSLDFQAACWTRGTRDCTPSFTEVCEPQAAPASTSQETRAPHPGGRRRGEPISHQGRLQPQLELWWVLQDHPGPGSGGHAGGGVGQSHRGGARQARGRQAVSEGSEFRIGCPPGPCPIPHPYQAPLQ